MSDEAATTEVPAEILRSASLKMIISHSNYLEALGGTERVVIERVESLMRDGDDVLVIYPVIESASSHYFAPQSYKLVFNGVAFGEVKAIEMNYFLASLSRILKGFEVHHLLFWPLAQTLAWLSPYFNKVPNAFYLHDFYFECPKVNAFCKSGDFRCRKSFGDKIVTEWNQVFRNALAKFDDIIAPSDFLANELDSSLRAKIRVKPTPVGTDDKKKLKLAYLGAGAQIKGYETWSRLANNPLITRKFDLYHLGNGGDALPGVTRRGYSYHDSRSSEASKLLSELNIDLVLLWSEVPESYSFTFFEARAADRYVITSKTSGNIAHEIAKSPEAGAVLDSELDLFTFLIRTQFEDRRPKEKS